MEMIYKIRRKPVKLLGLQAFDNRLPSNHRLKHTIEGEVAKVSAGYMGEQNFDKYLLEFMPAYPHAILHDVSLKYNQVYFQMDSVLITPAAIFIFEVKNITGKLSFQENPDRFTRQLRTGEIQAMQSPIVQLERKQYFLAQWLRKRNMKTPIKCVLVFAFTNELQLASPSKFPIKFAYQIPTYLHALSLDQGPLTDEKIKKLAREMIANHQAYNPFPILQRWDVSVDDIQRGVQCEHCQHFGMRWIRRKWHCPKCRGTSFTSHMQTSKDWFYLVSETLTNQQFRYFSMIEERNIVKRLLKNPNLELKGKGKNSYYILRKNLYEC